MTPIIIKTVNGKDLVNDNDNGNIDVIYKDNNDDDNLDKPRVTSATVIKPVNDGCLKNAALFSVTWPELDLPC